VGRPLALAQALVSGGFWQRLLCLGCEAQRQACLRWEGCERRGGAAAPSANGLGSGRRRRAALGRGEASSVGLQPLGAVCRVTTGALLPGSVQKMPTAAQHPDAAMLQVY